jgi:Ecdysteroid kinase-like family
MSRQSFCLFAYTANCLVFQIDYQISIHATPAIDLIYALYYFVSAENRQKHRADIITTYHQQFVASLMKFGYLKAPPSLIDLQVELLRNGSLEVLVAICMSIFFVFDFTTFTAEDLDMGEGTKRAKRRMYQTPGFREIIIKELPRFLLNGFI